jgi:hypothetical protein
MTMETTRKSSRAKKPSYKAKIDSDEQASSSQNDHKEQSMGRVNATLLRRLGDEKEVKDIDFVYGKQEKLISKPFTMPEHLLTVNPHFRFQVRSENNQGKL